MSFILFMFFFSWQWFEQFPEFLDNPFYISGESYAGIYVPTLAYEVVKGINIKLSVIYVLWFSSTSFSPYFIYIEGRSLVWDDNI